MKNFLSYDLSHSTDASPVKDAKRSSLRRVVQCVGALVINSLGINVFVSSQAYADESLFKKLFNEITGGIVPKSQGIVLETPRLADNGHSAAFRVYVESPMSSTDYVKSIFILSDRNPRPFIARFDLSPLNPRAEISTRVRLNGSQNVHALALTSKGEWLTAQVPVEVTESACLDAS